MTDVYRSVSRSLREPRAAASTPRVIPVCVWRAPLLGTTLQRSRPPPSSAHADTVCEEGRQTAGGQNASDGVAKPGLSLRRRTHVGACVALGAFEKSERDGFLTTDPETGVASGMPEAAICVQDFDVQCVLQFTLIHAAGCALHRHTSRVIHR